MTDPHAGQPLVLIGPPPGQSRATVIMVHGRGASPRNILELAPRLGQADCTFLAPAAADNTWYPFSFLSEISKNEPYLTSALRRIGTVVDDVLADGVARDHIVLLGFSQGACLVGEFACRHAHRYGGVVMFSGGLIGPPGTVWNHPGMFDAMPVFLGCSDRDAHIPKDRVDDSARVFSRMGATVTERIYPGMGHVVNEEEVAAARHVIDSLK